MFFYFPMLNYVYQSADIYSCSISPIEKHSWIQVSPLDIIASLFHLINYLVYFHKINFAAPYKLFHSSSHFSYTSRVHPAKCLALSSLLIGGKVGLLKVPVFFPES